MAAVPYAAATGSVSAAMMTRSLRMLLPLTKSYVHWRNEISTVYTYYYTLSEEKLQVFYKILLKIFINKVLDFYKKYVIMNI